MAFFELIGFGVVLYYSINIALWAALDCNIELAFKTKFGRSISSLRGQVVWITGASSGIGKYLAIALAKHGVRLAISARRVKELQDVREECLKESNGLLTNNDVWILPMDMLNISSHQECLSQVITHFGGLNILVNNAGRSQRANWVAIDIQVDRDLFELDVFSVIHLSRLVVKYFKSRSESKEPGHLAITSSGAGIAPVPFSASYSGAKHALHGYIHSLNVEDPSIATTLFCPGPIATNFLEEAFTANSYEKVGRDTKDDPNRMSAERCAKLYAVALANKISLSWCGIFPVNLLLYLSTVFPNLLSLAFRVLGTRRLAQIREGK